MFADVRRYFIDALSLCGYPLGHSQTVEMINSSLVSGVTLCCGLGEFLEIFPIIMLSWPGGSPVTR